MKPFIKWVGGLLLVVLSLLQVHAQTDTLCDPNENKKIFGELYFNYGTGTNVYSSLNRSTMLAGQPLVTSGNMLSQKNQGAYGLYSAWLLPPQPPILLATQGDFKDRIKLSWNMNALSPEPTGFVIYRDGSFLTELGDDVRQYLDFNTQAGEYYEYTIEAKNSFGTGSPSKAVGFVNPNGVVTGKIESNSGNPVPNVEVRLTPLTGNSMAFDGVNDELCVSYDEELPTDKFTVSAYVKLGDVNNEGAIIDWGSRLNKNWWITTTTSAEGKGYIFHIGNGTGSDSLKYFLPNLITNPYNVSDWHQITMVYNGSSMSVMVDGVFIGTKPANIVREKNYLNIGSKIGNDGFFKGKLDDIRIYNRPLSQTEVNNTKNRSVSKTESGLVSYWKMDEGVGVKVFDNTTIPTVANIFGATFSTDKPEVYSSGITDVTGYYVIDGINYSQTEGFRATPMKNFEFNSAVEFNAADKSYGNLTDYDMPDTSTVEVLFHPFDLKSRQTVLSKGSLYEAYIDNGKLFLNLNGTITDLGAVRGKYYHLAVTLDNTAGSAKIYLEGELSATVSFAGTSNWQNGSPWLLATNSTDAATGKFYTGLVDEFLIYKTALPQHVIQEHFVVGIPEDSTTAFLYSHYDLNEAIDTKVYDYATTNFGGETPREGILTRANWSNNARLKETKPHEFEPNVRFVNVNLSNTAVGNVDFKDVSTVNVSGYVRFANTFCFEDKVEILVNGSPFFPPIITDINGKWSADFEPGISVKLKANYKDHLFTPSFFELRKLQAPKAGIVFLDNTKRTISGQVAGNDICRKSIIPAGARVVVKVATLDGCFERTDTLRNPDGKFVFRDLPARAFRVSVVEHSNSVIYNYFQLKGGQEVDLRDITADTTDFIYYSSPQIEASTINGGLGCNPDTLILQGKSSTAVPPIYSTTFKVFEAYDGGKCYLDSAQITIKNQLSNLDDSTVTVPQSGFKYNFRVGPPNITPPYTKRIEAVTNVDGRLGQLSPVINAVVVGERDGGGNTFSSISAPLIVDILRDPPGDQSYAYREKGSTSCANFSVAVDKTAGETIGLFASVGPNFEVGTGVLAATWAKEVDFVAEGTQSWNHSRYQNQNISNQVCFTSSEIISTSASEDFIGKDGDVFIGTTINIIWGVNDLLIYDQDSCKLKLSKKLSVSPDKFNSTFIYTHHYIQNTLIKELKFLYGQETDIHKKQDYKKAYERWEQVLIDEDKRKILASVAQNEIITIDAGSSLERSVTSEKTTEKSITYREEFTFDSENSAGFFAGGVGAQFNFGFNLSTTTEGSQTNSETETKTYGYFIGDDNRGDGFAIAINNPSKDDQVPPIVDPEVLRKKISDLDDDYDSENATPNFDKLNFDRLLIEGNIDIQTVNSWKATNLYPSPIFKLLAGTTSCPYEGGRRRDRVELSSDVSQLINVPANTPGVFKLKLGNTSPSFESRTYAVKLVNESNPNGAIVKINGQPITGTPITFAVGSRALQEVTLTIEKGPIEYDYQDIQIAYYSECEYDQREALDGELDDEVYQTIALDVNFIEPCSPVDISFPLQDFVITPAAQNRLSVTLSEYNKADENLKLIRLQYRPIGGDGSWINISETLKADLGDVFTLNEWNTVLQKDGPYEIRAVAECNNVNLAPGISTVVKGEIARTPPVVFGVPEPGDGTWDPGDEISITFNEDINCDKVVQADLLGNNTIGLYDATTNALVAATITCVGSKIIIVPNINPVFYENRTFRVIVSGKDYDDAKLLGNPNHLAAAITDKAGNPMLKTVKWEFAVNQNNLEWLGNDVIEVNEVLKPFSVKRQVRNRGGSITSFRMEDVPSWLTVSPSTGTLNPGQTAEITLTFQEDLLIGDYAATLNMTGSKGKEPLGIDYRVRCPQPNYVVDNPTQFESSMNIVARLSIFDKFSVDPSDVIVAKIDGQIRGVGKVNYYRNIPPADATIDGTTFKPKDESNRWLVFMTVFGDETDNYKPITFSVWDGDKCNEYVEVINRINFQTGALVGSPIEPDTIKVINVVRKCIPLNRGWNWVSFNLDLPEGNTVTNVLASLQLKSGAIIKSEDLSAKYYANPINGWLGSLSAITPESRYMINVSQRDTVCIKGSPYLSEEFPITINPGWNWVGYVPSTGMTVTQALQGLTPLNGDLIKSQTLFAQYVAGIGWIGNLNFLEPLKGYLLKISNAGTLVYPTGNTNGPNNPDNTEGEINPKALAAQAAQEAPMIFDFTKYQLTMNLIGKVNGIAIDADDELRAYINGELVGINKSISHTDNRLFFQTIYFEDETNISFKLYKADRKAEYNLNRTIPFKSETLAGLVEDPIIFDLETTNLTPIAIDIKDQLIWQPTLIFPTVSIPSAVSGQSTACGSFTFNSVLPVGTETKPLCVAQTGLSDNMTGVMKISYNERSTFVSNNDVLSFINPATNQTVGCGTFDNQYRLFNINIKGGLTETPIDVVYYSDVMKKSFKVKSGVTYRSNRELGDYLTPAPLDISPLSITNNNGVITAVLRDTSWTGKYCLDAFALNCPNFGDGQTTFCFQRFKQGACLDIVVRNVTESTNEVVKAVSISSQVIINSGVRLEYKGGNKIELKPGFETKSGTVFTGKIEGCSN